MIVRNYLQRVGRCAGPEGNMTDSSRHSPLFPSEKHFEDCVKRPSEPHAAFVLMAQESRRAVPNTLLLH